MTTFWIAAALLFIFALLIVWFAFVKGKNTEQSVDNFRKETNINLYHEHLKEIEQDFADGAIDEASYQQLKAELDQSLLQDVDPNEQAIVSQGKASAIWPVAITLFIGGFSFYLYQQLGSYQYIDQPVAATQDDPHANLDMNQQALFRVQQLQQRVATEPTNSQAWFSLGQAYMNVGEYDNSVSAFKQVVTLVGEHAELIGPQAQALYYKNNQQMNGEIQALVDKALSLDAQDASTNVLLGMDAYGNQRFDQAIKHWQLVLDSGRPGINAQALAGAISEAQKQLAMASEMAGGDGLIAKPIVAGPKLTLEVEIDASVLEQLQAGEDKIVFVYATAANGPKMPLAAVKVYASDLPTTIVLDNSLAMTPQMNLSSFDEVNVFAVLSMAGSAGIQPGDYKAELHNIATNRTDPISLHINTLVTQ